MGLGKHATLVARPLSLVQSGRIASERGKTAPVLGIETERKNLVFSPPRGFCRAPGAVIISVRAAAARPVF